YKTLAEQPGNTRAAEVLTYLYLARGDLAGARAAAEKTDNTELEESLLFELGDWKGLVEKLPVPSGKDDVWAIGLRAACYRLSGQREAFEKAVGDLRNAKPPASWFAAEALFANDRPRDATELLIKGGELSRGFELLALHMKYREAFQLVDKA